MSSTVRGHVTCAHVPAAWGGGYSTAVALSPPSLSASVSVAFTSLCLLRLLCRLVALSAYCALSRHAGASSGFTGLWTGAELRVDGCVFDCMRGCVLVGGSVQEGLVGCGEWMSHRRMDKDEGIFVLWFLLGVGARCPTGETMVVAAFFGKSGKESRVGRR